MLSQAMRDGPPPASSAVSSSMPRRSGPWQSLACGLATWKLLPHAAVVCLDPSSFSALCLIILLVPEISVSQTWVSFSVARRVRQKPARSRVGGSLVEGEAWDSALWTSSWEPLSHISVYMSLLQGAYLDTLTLGGPHYTLPQGPLLSLKPLAKFVSICMSIQLMLVSGRPQIPGHRLVFRSVQTYWVNEWICFHSWTLIG